MYYHVIPEWIYQLDTNEKLIAFLKFIGKDDLITKFKTDGYLYVGELLNTNEPRLVESWNIDMAKTEDAIDFMDFGIKEEL